MKQTESKSKLNLVDDISNAVSDGVLGHVKVSKCLTTIYCVQTSNGNKHFIEASTGLNLAVQPSRHSLGMIAQNLCVAVHSNASYSYSAIDIASRWMETNTLSLPLSDRNITEYRGKFQCNRLEFIASNFKSDLSPAEMVGLPPTENETKAKRLFNVEGSVASDKFPEFNRMVENEDATLYFNTTTGEYSLIKNQASCARFYAPLIAVSANEIPDSAILEGLDGAPSFEFSKVLPQVTLNSRR